MPMTTPSASDFAHSWSLVYRRSVRTSSLAISHPSLGALVERRLHHHGLRGAAAAVDEEPGPLRGHRRGQVAEPDVLPQRGRRAAAGAHAHAGAGEVEERIAVPGDATAGDLE